MQASQYFAISVSLCSVLLGIAFLGCWTVLRKNKYLLWFATAYIVIAVPIATQSVMTNQELTQAAVLFGAFYLLSLSAMAQGMAQRYGANVQSGIALLVSLAALAGLYYFSRVVDDLRARMLIINAAMGLPLSLGARAAYRNRRSPDCFERILLGSYLCFLAYSVAIFVAIATCIEPNPSMELMQSPLWMLMLSASLLLNLWFSGVLLGVTFRDMLREVKNERDIDALTQLLNRRAFFERAPARIESSSNDSWALLICDVDHFKDINDTLGHAAGDRVLQAVAKVLKSNVRHKDLVVRLGGEEFVILLQCESLQSACAVADRMRKQLAHETLPLMRQTLTASFGVVLIKSAGQLQAAIDQADTLLYEAKKTGRNKVVSALEAEKLLAEFATEY